MLETHPFGNFVPKKAHYLILGSFTGKLESGYDWFYVSKRNQFWKIVEEVYGVNLPDRKSKQKLFSRIGIALADIIYSCERKQGTNLDANLVNITYNISGIRKLLNRGTIKKIFFSSRFVETKFRRLFKNVSQELSTLPSPSPRYAKLSLSQKVKIYKRLLPR